MAILVVPHVVEVTARGTISGRPWASVWHIANQPEWWQAGNPVQDVARDFANNWQDHIMPGLTNNVVLDSFAYLSLHSAQGTTGTLAPAAAKPKVGGDATAALPPNNTYLIKKHAGSRRGARSGRAYLPGVPEPGVDAEGKLNASLVSNLQTRMNTFFTGIDSAGALGAGQDLVIVHRPKEARLKGMEIVIGSFSKVDQLSVDGKVASQRRRLRG